MIRQQKKISIAIALLVSALFHYGCAHEKGPAESHSRGIRPFQAMVGIYQGPLNHLSSVKGSECPMYPSCSEYALDALERHGPVMGWIMATDRLMRCGRDVKERAEKVFIDGKWKYFDPVDANDFWWAEKGKEDRNGAP